MRSLSWIAIAGCGSMLGACGGASPGEEASPPPAVTSQAALSSTVTRTFSTGQAVDVGWADELSQGFVLAATDTTNRVATAFLSGTQILFDPTSQVCVTDPVLGSFCHYTRVTYDSIYANFDPGDLSVSGNTARLKTDLGAATAFSWVRCVFEEATLSNTCADLPPSGTILLQWQKTSAEYVKSIGITATKSGPHTVRVSGSRAFFSADTSGTFLGTALLHKSGSMGTSSSLTIDITRTP